MFSRGPPIVDRDAIPAGERIDAIDARMLGLMRFVLAFAALVIVWIDPAEPQRLVNLTYASLIIYCVYSAVVAWRAHRAEWPMPARAAHWADIAYYAFLVAITGGAGSLFFHFFLFAILSASFSRGFTEGISVTAASLALFLVVGFATIPAGLEFELNRTMARAVYLSVLGYMIAYWGGYEMLLKRRLKLLQQINNLGIPRFGVELAIEENLRRILDFYRGGTCVLVLERPGPPVGYRLYRASADQNPSSPELVEITESTATSLLTLPDSIVAGYRRPDRLLDRGFGQYYAYDTDSRARTEHYRAECEALANLLDTHALTTVPYTQPDDSSGRIFLTLERGTFTHSDVHFLAQAAGVMSTAIGNLFLMEELINRAAESERLKISRNLHDTTIQPYIGLRLALDALRREAGPDDRLAGRITELVEMTDLTIQDLRSFAASLKEETSMPGEFLVSAVKRQAERLGRFYEVHVDVEADLPSGLNGGIAAHAFQIVSEGLSNVLRHTSAKNAFVSLRRDDSGLHVDIGNETNGAADATGFTPRSITERVRSLGGSVRVGRNPEGFTVVHIDIPLRAA